MVHKNKRKWHPDPRITRLMKPFFDQEYPALAAHHRLMREERLGTIKNPSIKTYLKCWLYWREQAVREIEKETESKIRERRFSWLSHSDSCNDIVDSVVETVPKKERLNSFLILRLFEVQKTLLFLQMCANYGAYRHLIRELRFFLESFVQAYYLDKTYPRMNICEKFEELEKNQRDLYGIKLLETLNFKPWDGIYRFYTYLSKHGHSSPEELREAIEGGKITDRFVDTFDKDLYRKCVLLTNQALDHAFYFTLRKYPKAILKLMEKENISFWFNKLEYERTKNLMSTTWNKK